MLRVHVEQGQLELVLPCRRIPHAQIPEGILTILKEGLRVQILPR